jgi:predicted secreted protein with PEFG-CTERM motif
MKTRATSTFFVLLAIAGLVATVPSAFADHSEVTVTVASGSGTPGCEETAEGCYLPKEVTVDVGGKVIFSNTDTAAHTFTAGTPSGGPTGEFDTGLVMAGGTYEATLETEGTVGYFCMVHPWMVGSIIVQAAAEEDNMESEDLMVDITTNKGSADGERMSIDVAFKTIAGDAVEHVNYKITATQDGQEVLNEAKVHTHNGLDTQMTAPLPNAVSADHPVDVQVEFLGFGLPGEEAKWSGPVGQVATKKVVPEFGTVAMMILGVAIVSIIAISAKSRVIPRI